VTATGVSENAEGLCKQRKLLRVLVSQQVVLRSKREYGAGTHYQKDKYVYVLSTTKTSRKVSGMSTQIEIVAHLGRLVRAERARLGYTSVQKASEAADIGNYRTLGQFELGHTMPQPPNRAKIETLLMWRDGSLTEALSKDVDELTFDWFRDWEKEERVTEAAQLTDEALLTDVIKRLDKIRLEAARVPELEARVRELEARLAEQGPHGDVIANVTEREGDLFGKRTPAQNGPKMAYDLAAHTPRSGKKVDPRKSAR